MTATASGGSTPYTYVWSDGLAMDPTDLLLETYTVTVTDGNGCTATDRLYLSSTYNSPYP
ncbi:MAG: hypothetical protein IPG48_09430 [Saprospiraceae bacterium]|nr:hypothetical protein [Saprospiraceae bacterium]